MDKKVRDVKIIDKSVVEASVKRNLWVVTTEQGVTKEDILNPAFWSLVAWKFRPYDRLEVRAGDGEFFAEYLILSCEKTYAKLKELSFIELSAKDADISAQIGEEFEYKLRGPRGHSVVRKADNQLMKEGLASKDEAVQWILDHKRNIAA